MRALSEIQTEANAVMLEIGGLRFQHALLDKRESELMARLIAIETEAGAAKAVAMAIAAAAQPKADEPKPAAAAEPVAIPRPDLRDVLTAAGPLQTNDGRHVFDIVTGDPKAIALAEAKLRTKVESGQILEAP